MDNKKSLSFLIITSLVLIILSSLPYIYGMFICPSDGVFTGYTKNIDDMAVYGSWVKQISLGHIILENKFQATPGMGRQFNAYFLLLGLFSRIAHTSPSATLHIFRILQGICLVFVFWLFTGLFTKNDNKRKIATIVFLFGSGFGYFLHSATTIDVWQPEAITFMSVYLNPLFTVSLILIISVFYSLVKLWQTQNNKYIIFGGVVFFLLGNIHTYDVVNIFVLWIVFLIYRLFSKGGFLLWIKNSYKEILVLAIGVITPFINFMIYRADPIYKARVDTTISTHPIYDILLGYGLVFIFALVGVIFLFKIKFKDKKEFIPLCLWFVLNLITIYIPFSQQRKFIMGYEIPLAILCAYGIYYSLVNVKYKKYIFAFCVIVMFMTNLYVMQIDMDCLTKRTTQAKYCPYLSYDEIDVMKHIDDEPIMAPPELALFIPEYTGHSVYYGHWSESPNFQTFLKDYNELSLGRKELNYIKMCVFYEKMPLIFDKNYKLVYNNSSCILCKNKKEDINLKDF